MWCNEIVKDLPVPLAGAIVIQLKHNNWLIKYDHDISHIEYIINKLDPLFKKYKINRSIIVERYRSLDVNTITLIDNMIKYQHDVGKDDKSGYINKLSMHPLFIKDICKNSLVNIVIEIFESKQTACEHYIPFEQFDYDVIPGSLLYFVDNYYSNNFIDKTLQMIYKMLKTECIIVMCMHREIPIKHKFDKIHACISLFNYAKYKVVNKYMHVYVMSNMNIKIVQRLIPINASCAL